LTGLGEEADNKNKGRVKRRTVNGQRNWGRTTILKEKSGKGGDELIVGLSQKKRQGKAKKWEKVR